MFVTTAIIPATSLVSAQPRPIIVPTTSKATIAANQYRIRRLVMMLRLLPSGRFANRGASQGQLVARTEGLRKGGGGLRIPLGQRIAHMAPKGRLGLRDPLAQPSRS